MPSSRLQRRFAFWWLALALALVLAPALGRVHQVLHAPLALGTASAGQAATVVRGAQAAQGTRQVVDVPHGLFASHVGVDCLLLDQQLLGGALLAAAHAALLVHAPPNARPTPPTTARVGARRLWAPLARAPPAQT